MRKEQELTPKGEQRQAGNEQLSESKMPSSGITQPHKAKKVALGPNTKR